MSWREISVLLILTFGGGAAGYKLRDIQDAQPGVMELLQKRIDSDRVDLLECTMTLTGERVKRAEAEGAAKVYVDWLHLARQQRKQEENDK